MRNSRSKFYVIAGVIVGIAGIFHLAGAQDSETIINTTTYVTPVPTLNTTVSTTQTYPTTDTTSNTIVNPSDTVDTTVSSTKTTLTSVVRLLPPEHVDVLREGEITMVLIDAGINKTDTLYGYRIYRRCAETTWWALAKVAVRECGGYACSYKVTDRPAGDICEYAISSVDVVGTESERTPPKKPLISENTSTPTAPIPEPVSTTTSLTTAQDATVSTTTNIIYTLITGRYVLKFRAPYLQSVEWLMFPAGSKTSTYLGKALYNKETDYWEYAWETTSVPNGEYVLVPKPISSTGQTYEPSATRVRVKNEMIVNPAQSDTTLTEIIKDATDAVSATEKTTTQKETIAKENIVQTLTPYIQEAQNHIGSKGEEAIRRELIAEGERMQKQLITLINIESTKLLGAFNGDEEEMRRFENKVIIAAQKSTENIDTITKEFGIELSQEELDLLKGEVSRTLGELEGVIKERREVLRGRVGDTVFEDSDKDGISNYDEVNIYKTDPLKPDSDGDGFLDGAEILGGFDPLSAGKQAIIEYEHPRIDGFVEDDIFAVDTVKVVATSTNSEGKEDVSKISFTGVAPANSFVSLFVYSTPIMVIVKTDKDGNWSYVLDKELEDGNHEVYVAITDNAGKIYAKSKPLPFVKEASAVTIDERALFVGEPTAPSVFQGAYLYIISLLIIVIIGWALVFTASKQTRI